MRQIDQSSLAKETRLAQRKNRTCQKSPQRRKAKNRIALLLLTLAATPCLAEDWLQWGGPNGDFRVDAKNLADTWPTGGPKQLWKRPLGDGYSAILYKDGHLFTAYRRGNRGFIISLDAVTGASNWEHPYDRTSYSDMRPQFGTGPNATPLIMDDRIIAISIDGVVRCLDLATGTLLWSHDLPAEFGRRKRVEEYGYSQSPMRYRSTVLVHVGGDNHAIVAFNPKEGSILWKSEAGNVSYAQATIAKLAGLDQFIYFSPEGVNGLDPKTGKPLWHFPIEFSNGNHLTPVVKCDENNLWVTSQFRNGGGRLLNVTNAGSGLDVKQIWFTSKLRASCWTHVRQGDFVYGSAGGHDASFLAATNWRTGKIAWRKRGHHMAQCLYADDKLLFLDQSGKLTLAKVSPTEFKVLASTQVTASVSWTLPTLVSTKLYLRDRKHILALDLSKQANPTSGG